MQGLVSLWSQGGSNRPVLGTGSESCHAAGSESEPSVEKSAAVSVQENQEKS